jgi:hypothetical protein
MRKIKFIAILTACLLASLFSGCNNYEYTAVTITMVNQSSEPVYLWMEYCEERNATTLVAANSSRTFHQAFTFTEEHPQTHVTVVATKNEVYCGEVTILVNADTTNFTVVYNAETGIAVTQKD